MNTHTKTHASPRCKFVCQSACMRAVAKKASMHMCMHVVLHVRACVYVLCMCRLSIIQTEYMHRITKLPCLQILPRGSQRSNHYIPCYDCASVVLVVVSSLLLVVKRLSFDLSIMEEFSVHLKRLFSVERTLNSWVTLFSKSPSVFSVSLCTFNIEQTW